MSAAGTIELRAIRAWGHHGANPGEQDVVQPFDIDIALELDLTAASASDNLDDTIDYASLHRLIVTLVARERYALLERLGDAILRAVMADPRILRARVAIAKPRLLSGATPVVTLHRAR